MADWGVEADYINVFIIHVTVLDFMYPWFDVFLAIGSPTLTQQCFVFSLCSPTVVCESNIALLFRVTRKYVMSMMHVLTEVVHSDSVSAILSV